MRDVHLRPFHSSSNLANSTGTHEQREPRYPEEGGEMRRGFLFFIFFSEKPQKARGGEYEDKRKRRGGLIIYAAASVPGVAEEGNVVND